MGQAHTGRPIRAGSYGQAHTGRLIRAGSYGQAHTGRPIRAGPYGQAHMGFTPLDKHPTGFEPVGYISTG